MKIGTPKEIFEGENRVAMTPDSALQLQKLGHTCVIETGAGAAAGFDDAAYEVASIKKACNAPSSIVHTTTAR